MSSVSVWHIADVDELLEETDLLYKGMCELVVRNKTEEVGVLITTSYVDGQAYNEVVEDGHPILIVTAADIAGILRSNAINSTNIDVWLNNLDRSTSRLEVYYRKLAELSRD